MGGRQSNEWDRPVKIKKGFKACYYSDSEFGDFTTRETIDELSEEKNYGILPENVFRKIMQFLSPKDLLSCMLSCRLVNMIASSPLFWKGYYSGFFKVDNNGSDENMNWKKQFFKRYYFKSEFYITKKKYIPISAEDHKINHNKYDYGTQNVVLVGDSCGKRLFLKTVDRNSENVARDEKKAEVLVGCVTAGRLSFLRLESYETEAVMQTKDQIDDVFFGNVGVFLCFNVTKRSTFESVKRIITKSKPLTKYFKKNWISPILLGFQNINEHKKEREIRSEEVREFIESHNSRGKSGKIFGYIECILDEQNRKTENVYLSIGLIVEAMDLCERYHFDMLLREERASPTGDPRDVLFSLVEHMEDLKENEKDDILKALKKKK